MSAPRIDIILTPVGRDRWSATADGEIIVRASREPEFAACRALLARGITGSAVFRHAGSKHASMILDIARAADRCIIEGATIGPVRRRFKLHPRAAERPAPRAHVDTNAIEVRA